MTLAKVYWDKEIKIALLVFITILFIIAIILLCYELFFNRNNQFLFKKHYKRNVLINSDRKYDKTKVFVKENLITKTIITLDSYSVRRVVNYKPSKVIENNNSNLNDSISNKEIIRKIYKK